MISFVVFPDARAVGVCTVYEVNLSAVFTKLIAVVTETVGASESFVGFAVSCVINRCYITSAGSKTTVMLMLSISVLVDRSEFVGICMRTHFVSASIAFTVASAVNTALFVYMSANVLVRESGVSAYRLAPVIDIIRSPFALAVIAALEVTNVANTIVISIDMCR